MGDTHNLEARIVRERAALEPVLERHTLLRDTFHGRASTAGRAVELAEQYDALMPTGKTFLRLLRWYKNAKQYMAEMEEFSETLGAMGTYPSYSSEELVWSFDIQFRARASNFMFAGGFGAAVGGAGLIVVPPLAPIGLAMGIWGLGAELMSGILHPGKEEMESTAAYVRNAFTEMGALSRVVERSLHLRNASNLMAEKPVALLRSYSLMLPGEQSYIDWRLMEDLHAGSLDMDEPELRDTLAHAKQGRLPDGRRLYGDL